MKVIFLARDERLAAPIVSHLLQIGATVVRHTRCEEAARTVSDERFDIGLVDVALDGAPAFVSRLRKERVFFPILLIGDSGRIDERVRGLDSGADDYLARPVSIEELGARLRALHRRARKFNGFDTTIDLANLSVDSVRREAAVDSRRLELRPKEYAVLKYLCENAGTVLSKERIIEHVWGYRFDTGTNILEVIVSRLRNKLRRAGGAVRIRTAYGAGYTIDEDDR